MKTSLMVTDLTRMENPHVCVAGYTPKGVCIRPVFPPPGFHEAWLYRQNKVVIRPFAEIRIDVIPANHHEAPHMEDWLIVSEAPIQRRMLLDTERRMLLEQTVSPNVASIFNAPIYHVDRRWFVKTGEGTQSLGTIGPVQIQQVEIYDSGAKQTPHLTFTDNSNVSYRLNPTDLSFRYYIRYLRLVQGLSSTEIENKLAYLFAHRDVFLRIGLTRGTWKEHPNCCHVQITGVYSFPDYLDGKCFADFPLPI